MSTSQREAEDGGLGKPSQNTIASGDRMKRIEDMALEYDLADVVRAIESLQPTPLYETDKRLELIEGHLQNIHEDLHRLSDALVKHAEPQAPVGWFALVLGVMDKGSEPTAFEYGEVLAYYPETNTLFIKDGLGEICETRLYEADDENIEAYSVGPVHYFATEDRMIEALVAQRELERLRRERPVRQESLL